MVHYHPPTEHLGKVRMINMAVAQNKTIYQREESQKNITQPVLSGVQTIHQAMSSIAVPFVSPPAVSAVSLPSAGNGKSS